MSVERESIPIKMKTYLAKTPNLISKLFSNQVWSFSTKEKVLYLTFDDGPTPRITNWVLDTLNKYNAKATFFCIGKNVEQHPQIFQDIIDKGHSIGNHTYNHLNGWKTNTDVYLQSILKTEKLIQESKISTQSRSVGTKLFRPPYGKIKPSQTKLLLKNNYKIVMWSVLSGDFDSKITPEKCLKNVINNSKNGSILVFHDSKKAFDKLQIVLPKILEHFNKKGYTFKKVV